MICHKNQKFYPNWLCIHGKHSYITSAEKRLHLKTNIKKEIIAPSRQTVCWKWQQEEKAMTNIHRNYRKDEAIHSRGRKEKHHQYLTLFYGEATWFCPGASSNQLQLTRFVYIEGVHTLFLCVLPLWSDLLGDQKPKSMVIAPSSLTIPGIITQSLLM